MEEGTISVDTPKGRSNYSLSLADHIADLDAHTKNMYEELVIGQYHTSFPAEDDKADTVIIADTLYGSLFLVARTLTIDRLALYVATADAGKSARLGIYNCDSDMEPSTLILDAGEVSVASTGWQAATISQQLKKGLYFLAMVSDGTPTVSYAKLGWSPLGMFANAPSLFYSGYTASHSYAVLPASFGTPTIIYATNVVYYRLSSLD